MSKGQTIAKLEAILARVRSRAVEPRGARQASAVAAVDVSLAAPPTPATPTIEVVEPAPDLIEQAVVQPSRRPALMTENEIVVEVDVQTATQDAVVAVVAEEVSATTSLESRERLVAAEPAPSEPQVAVAELVLDEPGEPELARELLAEPSDVEDAPASSRRPVALQREERLAEMAFGAEEPQPARHTPPPESGRLPAAPPVEDAGDVTGVHQAGKSASIVPEATIADLAPSDVVAEVVGAPRELVPPTFLALLDASIAL